MVAPQAIRSMIPPLLNDFIGLQKDTSLISFVGVLDAFNQARIIASNSFNLSAVTGVGLFFIVVTIPMARTCRSPERSQRAPYPGDPLMPPLLTLSGVEKSFRGTHVLRGVDLSVNEHQVISLIGPSGCGKSTLLRCINALEDIDAGEIRLDGDLVSGLGVDVNRLHRHVGIVFQSFNLFPHMSVMSNITLVPRKVLRRSRADAEAHAEAILRRIGLWEKAKEYPDRLSGGQQQRLAIARALAMGPRLLLLDEVTSALDPELVGEVLAIIRELADDGMTMILATTRWPSQGRSLTPCVFSMRGGSAKPVRPPRCSANPSMTAREPFCAAS